MKPKNLGGIASGFKQNSEIHRQIGTILLIDFHGFYFLIDFLPIGIR